MAMSSFNGRAALKGQRVKVRLGRAHLAGAAVGVCREVFKHSVAHPVQTTSDSLPNRICCPATASE